MAVKDKDQLAELLYGKDGAPFVRVVAKSSISTMGFLYGKDGAPFVAAEGGSSPPPDPDPGPGVSNSYIMVVMAS